MDWLLCGVRKEEEKGIWILNPASQKRFVFTESASQSIAVAKFGPVYIAVIPQGLLSALSCAALAACPLVKAWEYVLRNPQPRVQVSTTRLWQQLPPCRPRLFSPVELLSNNRFVASSKPIPLFRNKLLTSNSTSAGGSGRCY